MVIRTLPGKWLCEWGRLNLDTSSKFTKIQQCKYTNTTLQIHNTNSTLEISKCPRNTQIYTGNKQIQKQKSSVKTHNIINLKWSSMKFTWCLNEFISEDPLKCWHKNFCLSLPVAMQNHGLRGGFYSATQCNWMQLNSIQGNWMQYKETECNGMPKSYVSWSRYVCTRAKLPPLFQLW